MEASTIDPKYLVSLIFSLYYFIHFLDPINREHKHLVTLHGGGGVGSNSTWMYRCRGDFTT